MYWASSDDQMRELTIPYLGGERADSVSVRLTVPRPGRLAMGSDWSVSTANPLTQIEVGATGGSGHAG